MVGSKTLHKKTKKKSPVKRPSPFKKVGETGRKKLSFPTIAELEEKYGKLIKNNGIVVRAEFSHVECVGALSAGFPVFNAEVVKFKKGKRPEVLQTIHEVLKGKSITGFRQLSRIKQELVTRDLVTITHKEIKLNDISFMRVCGS